VKETFEKEATYTDKVKGNRTVSASEPMGDDGFLKNQRSKEVRKMFLTSPPTSPQLFSSIFFQLTNFGNSMDHRFPLARSQPQFLPSCTFLSSRVLLFYSEDGTFTFL
jgi:hypothetical protein